MRLWEQHCCVPLAHTADLSALARYPQGSHLSINVGYSPHSKTEVAALCGEFRRQVLADDRLVMVDADPVEGATTVAFDLEDSGPIEGDLANVEYVHGLGVRSMLPTYNFVNAAGCGCLDSDDTGLTSYGRDLVAEMNRVGMLVDGSHCSIRTGLDLAAVTQAPMIYSHSNFAALWSHPRNITDEQARECAQTGGVVGINGVGIFLGVNGPAEADARVQAMADHIEYAVELLGVEHVGIGSDYSFDHEDFNAEMAAHPEAFSQEYTRYGPLQWVPPEGVASLPSVLAERGFDAESIAAVHGGNFARVARIAQATGG
ncbi:membrane dipeptidase [Rhodococcus sp. KRD162]|uniref:dipeptidase n=1 Tax=unclassified Rhodococcus (in: high G+C Gram-positive bacteria) TaxID=192944 RepID=UPI0027DD3BD1|nr:membrane dipeptidase [Rhodococcus sp. KRD162]